MYTSNSLPFSSSFKKWSTDHPGHGENGDRPGGVNPIILTKPVTAEPTTPPGVVRGAPSS
jgi:hypothetical protein